MTSSSVLMGAGGIPGLLALEPLPLFLEETAADRGMAVVVAAVDGLMSSVAGGQW